MKRSMRLTLELANTTKMEMEKNINNFLFMNFTTIIIIIVNKGLNIIMMLFNLVNKTFLNKTIKTSKMFMSFLFVIDFKFMVFMEKLFL